MIALKQIGVIRTDFPEKFGIPRQSGLIDELRSTLVFEPEFRVPEALRGIEQYSHLWLIWEFSKAVRDGWSPTVRRGWVGIRAWACSRRAPLSVRIRWDSAACGLSGWNTTLPRALYSISPVRTSWTARRFTTSNRISRMWTASPGLPTDLRWLSRRACWKFTSRRTMK